MVFGRKRAARGGQVVNTRKRSNRKSGISIGRGDGRTTPFERGRFPSPARFGRTIFSLDRLLIPSSTRPDCTVEPRRSHKQRSHVTRLLLRLVTHNESLVFNATCNYSYETSCDFRRELRATNKSHVAL